MHLIIDQNVADLKERLKITDDDSRADAFEKVKANAAKRKAKNKVKNRVDQSDLDVIEDLQVTHRKVPNCLR